MKTSSVLFRSWKSVCFIFCMSILGVANTLQAQVTTSSMSGFITDENGGALLGATVVAVHQPSGTRYGTVTNEDGRYTLPGMRVGGPYQVTVSYVGYQEIVKNNVFLSLGTAATLDFKLQEEAVNIEGVEVVANRNDVFSSNRTGAATNITTQQLNSLPTLNRNFIDFSRLTPQASTAGSGTSFGGQDNRLNNITIDGSLLNNSFGLAGEPGGRTGIAPISLDAIEEVQVNLAPYDVRQAGFTGAGINAVTKSGTNEIKGSVFYTFRNQDFTGTKAGSVSIDRARNEFDNKQYGISIGGPIIKNKLFFFLNTELERRSNPFTLLANKGNEQVVGNTTRVLRSDLDDVSKFLRDNYGYETGPYEGYNFETTGNKYLAKLDWNLNDNNRISVRFTRLDSEKDQVISNSSSLGFGGRSNNQALSYQNSNYIIFDKITSVIGEWNSIFNNKMSNNLIAGYTFQNEDRGTYGTFFPLIEIQKDGSDYISAGFEPFTPSNQLQYKTYQFQDNLSIYLNKHTVTAGLSAERLEFVNVFYPGSQGVFVYSSLEDFYKDLTASKDNPSRDTSSVTLRRFQYRYSLLEGGAEPVQPSKVTYAGLYLQDEWAVSPRFNLTGGVRVDVPFFAKTGYENKQVLEQSYRDADGNSLKVSTAKLPDAKPLFSPRIGFNLDVTGDKTFQIRGGTGIFTGKPAFVWISNQIGNNGVLTGFESVDNTKSRPFTTDPGRFITNRQTPSSYEINITDTDFKFPQVWRSNIAVDKKLPWNLVGTVEFIYNKDVNGVLYQNINEEAATSTFAGPDNRPRYPGVGLSSTALNNAVRINDNVTGAYYLTNQNQGDAYTVTVSLERKFLKGFFTKAAYNYGSAKNLVDAGSIAGGSYTGNPTVNGGNHPDLSYTNFDQRHRVLAAFTYRAELFKFLAPQIGLFINGATQGRYTYVYSGDFNGDGVANNDLIFVPNKASDLKFVSLTSNGITFTPEQQAAALDAYIEQDDYLKGRRGKYAERNGGLYPMLWRADLSFSMDFFINAGGKRNTLQFRADILNFTNMINKDWGLSQGLVQSNGRLLVSRGVDANGVPQVQFVTTGSGTSTKLLDKTFTKNATFGADTYSIQLGLRYTFN